MLSLLVSTCRHFAVEDLGSEQQTEYASIALYIVDTQAISMQSIRINVTRMITALLTGR
jgi:hypothetical protein